MIERLNKLERLVRYLLSLLDGGGGGTSGDLTLEQARQNGNVLEGDIEISEDTHFQLIRNKGEQRSLLALNDFQVHLDYTDLIANVTSQVYCRPSEIRLDHGDSNGRVRLKLNSQKLILDISYNDFYQGFGSNKYFANPQQNDFIQKKYADLQHSYSTEETKIGGTWIDGKPIYTITKLTADPIPADMETQFPNVIVGSYTVYKYTKTTD